MYTDRILILDFGGTQAYYTARRLRGERFFCEILPGSTDSSEIIAYAPKGIMLIGGDNEELRAQPLPFDLDALNLPILAFGGAARMLAEHIGAEHRGIQLEEDKDFVQFSRCELFDGLDENDRYFERVDGYALPEGYAAIAQTPSNLMPAFANIEKQIYALQFYVENNDPDGLRILENFAEQICHCARNWDVEHFGPYLIEQTKSQLDNSNVLLPISGGVDTAVTAALLHRAIGNRLSCLFIDTGLLRKGDREFIRRAFNEQMGLKLIELDAQARFLKALSGLRDPAEKRRAVYAEFSAAFAEAYIKAGEYECMAEGTIYSDIIKKNPLMITNMIDGCRRIEPIRQLFKEEVRALGRWLGVPEELVNRPSFESSGLSVRCLGEVTPERLDMLREADAIFRSEVEGASLARKIAQYFVILTDMQTPGSSGTGYVCVLRALGSSNAGKASAYKLPYDLMDLVVQRITQEVPGITHVVYDITGRPTATVEWE